MRVKVVIIDAFVKDNVGSVIEVDDDSRLFFPCTFAQCYGERKGFALVRYVEDMRKNKETHKRIKVNCGGYGDHNFCFCCDNYMVLEITISDTL